jgi:hypothetical protein
MRRELLRTADEDPKKTEGGQAAEPKWAVLFLALLSAVAEITVVLRARVSPARLVGGSGRNKLRPRQQPQRTPSLERQRRRSETGAAKPQTGADRQHGQR